MKKDMEGFLEAAFKGAVRGMRRSWGMEIKDYPRELDQDTRMVNFNRRFSIVETGMSVVGGVYGGLLASPGSAFAAAVGGVVGGCAPTVVHAIDGAADRVRRLVR
jgi:hypothetical protein